MEEYDILGGQNILWSILHIFRGQDPINPMIYKVVFGLVGVNIDDFFEFNHAANTIGHAYNCLSREVSIIFEIFLLILLLMCGTDCRHLSALHHCQHSGEQYRTLILVSS